MASELRHPGVTPPTQVESESVEERGAGRGQGAPGRPPAAGGWASALTWPVLTVVIVIGFWALVSHLGLTDPIIFPAPGDVAVAIVDLVQKPFFWKATWQTVEETLLGFALGVGGAWILGTLIGMFRVLRLSLYPLSIAFQNMPRIAFAPLVLTWFGFGVSGKVVLAATLCFFPVLLNAIVGIDAVDEEARRVLRSYGASRWQEYRKLTLPSSLPLLFAGVKTGITLALIGAIVAEFVGGSVGLGVLIKDLNFQLAIAEGFAVLVMLAVIGIAMYGVMELLERKLVFWRGHG